MGVYPLALVGGLLLMISVLGITNTFPASSVDVKSQNVGRHQPVNAAYLSSQEERLLSE